MGPNPLRERWAAAAVVLRSGITRWAAHAECQAAFWSLWCDPAGIEPRSPRLRADHLPLGPLPSCRKCLCKCELVHRRADGATATEGKNIWGCMNFKSTSYDQRRPDKEKARPYRLGAPAVFHRGSFLISLLVLGYYDRSCLNDWLFVLLWGRLSFLSTNW